MLEPIVDFFSLVPRDTFNVVSFVLGIWCGNHLAVKRDKRKEFNDAAEPVRALFQKAS